MIKLSYFFAGLMIIWTSRASARNSYPTNRTASLEKLLIIGERQKYYFVDCWKVPHAWVNPSISYIPRDDKGRVVMVWRMFSRKKRDQIGYMIVDPYNNWNVSKAPDIVEMISINGTTFNRWYLFGEDARVFVSNQQLYLTYNTHLTHWKRLYLTPVSIRNGTGDIYATREIHITFEHEVGPRHQKNWIPFDYLRTANDVLATQNQSWSSTTENSSSIATTSVSSIVATGTTAAGASTMEATSATAMTTTTTTTMTNNSSSAAVVGVAAASGAQLLFIYSIIPHRIVQLLPTDKADELKGSTVSVTRLVEDRFWPYGELRGGTNAVRIGDKYLTFFHSSNKHIIQVRIMTYFMGAYLFDTKPPFAITHVTPEPIIHPALINDTLEWAYKGVDFVIFPMGLIVNETHITVSIGRNDRESWMMTLHRGPFLESLKKVDSKVIGDSTWVDGKPLPGTYRNITRDSYHRRSRNRLRRR
jgi:predicted GH43/DUF377 family glycosyl hydrolase